MLWLFVVPVFVCACRVSARGFVSRSASRSTRSGACARISIATMPPIDSPARANRGGAVASSKVAASSLTVSWPIGSAWDHRARRGREPAPHPRITHHPGYQDQRCHFTRRAPSLSVASFAHAISGSTAPKPANVPKPQSDPSGNHAVCPENIGKTLEPLCNKIGMFDKIRGGVHSAWYQNLVIRISAARSRKTVHSWPWRGLVVSNRM